MGCDILSPQDYDLTSRKFFDLLFHIQNENSQSFAPGISCNKDFLARNK